MGGMGRMHSELGWSFSEVFWLGFGGFSGVVTFQSSFRLLPMKRNNGPKGSEKKKHKTKDKRKEVPNEKYDKILQRDYDIGFERRDGCCSAVRARTGTAARAWRRATRSPGRRVCGRRGHRF